MTEKFVELTNEEIKTFLKGQDEDLGSKIVEIVFGIEKRKSITDFDILNFGKIVEFAKNTFKEICSIGLNEHKYFKEFEI